MEVYQPEHRPTPRPDYLAAARAYAEKGILVFPCRPDKSPYTPKGFGDATTDPRKITAWWTRWPEARIGVPTGPRFWVLDVDKLAALEGLAGKLPDTWTVRTPRGGLHLYFRPAEGIGNGTGNLPEGIDVRGMGTGYVLAPPSPGYKVENKAPIAEAPGWLLEAVRRDPRTSESSGERPAKTRTCIDVEGPPIPAGTRNTILASIAGRLHDGTRNPAQLAADLEGINAARCQPPLPAAEVEKIAASIARLEPCKGTGATPKVVREELAQIEAEHLWGRSWSGVGWKSPRSLLAALIKLARVHGTKTAEGVRVSASIRQLARAAGLGSVNTVRRSIGRLVDAGIVRRINATSPEKSGGLVLIAPVSLTSKVPTTRDVSTVESSDSRLIHPNHTGGDSGMGVSTLSSERLRWSAPVYQFVDGSRVRVGTILRLSKSAEEVVDALEAAGRPLTLRELADGLGMKRPWNLTRGGKGPVPRLEERGVVKVDGDTVSLRLALDWLNILDRARAEDREIEDRQRDERRHAEETRRHRDRLKSRKLSARGQNPAEIAAELGIGLEEVLAHLGLWDRLFPPSGLRLDKEDDAVSVPPCADGFIEELERVEEEPVKKTAADIDPALVCAVGLYLTRNPDRIGKPAGWIANTLWCLDLYPGKPTREEVAQAVEITRVRRVS